MTFDLNIIRNEIRAKARTAGETCWLFNSHPMIRAANMTLGRRIELLVSLFKVTPGNARVETLIYYNNRGDKHAARQNILLNIVARPPGVPTPRDDTPFNF